mgnify:CR=1 FL=1
MSNIDEDEHIARLDAERTEDGRYRPTVHVVMSDGRVTEFKNRCLLIPEEQGFDPNDHAGNSIHAVLVNGKGELLYDAETGEPAIVPVPPLALRFDPEHLETYSQAAERAAVSKSTIKRAIRLLSFLGSNRYVRPSPLSRTTRSTLSFTNFTRSGRRVATRRDSAWAWRS